MKKYCSSCGNQLELSQRFCAQCGEVNPFFVPAFTLLTDQREALEKLRLEKEKIENELSEKLKAQQEFERQQKEQAELEEAIKQNKIKQEQEIINAVKQAQEKKEAELKQEILNVKEASEHYRQQTTEVVAQLRQELNRVEEENKRILNEFESINKQAAVAVVEPEVTMPPIEITPMEANSDSQFERKALTAIIVFLFFICSGLLLFFILNSNFGTNTNKQLKQASNAVSVNNTPALETDNTNSLSVTKQPIVPDSSVINEPVSQHDVATVASVVEKVTVSTDASVKSKNEGGVLHKSTGISSQTIVKDIVGQKISGCDIVIKSVDEVSSIKDLRLIEKLPGSQSKYKFTVEIIQGKHTYRASPYVYYQSNGTFLKLDGANCE